MTKKESGFIVSGAFAPLMGILRFGDVSTDNNIFKLHYRVTVVLLSVFTLMISSKQFFGEPIHCIGDDVKHKDAINSYCWLYGTYTVKKHLKGNLFFVIPLRIRKSFLYLLILVASFKSSCFVHLAIV